MTQHIKRGQAGLIAYMDTVLLRQSGVVVRIGCLFAGSHAPQGLFIPVPHDVRGLAEILVAPAGVHIDVAVNVGGDTVPVLVGLSTDEVHRITGLIHLIRVDVHRRPALSVGEVSELHRADDGVSDARTGSDLIRGLLKPLGASVGHAASVRYTLDHVRAYR